MAFAFVFADACASSAPTQTITVAGDDVDVNTRNDAEIYLRLVDSPLGQYLMQMKMFADWGVNVKNELRVDLAMPYFFDPEIFAAATSQEGVTDALRQRIDRRYWSVIAAAKAAEKMGLLSATDKAAKAYLEVFFKDPANPEDPKSERVFNEKAYAEELQKFGVDPSKRDSVKIFERMYADIVYPVTLATRAIEYTTGWASPMELDFALSAMYDTTVARAMIVKDARDVTTIEVAPEAIAAWYDANKQAYKHPETRAIEYVKVPVEGFVEAATAACNKEEGGIEMLALEYYEANREMFKDAEGNQLQYEGDVVQQAIEKVKVQEAVKLAKAALNDTVTTLNTLSTEAATVRFAEDIVAKYGAVATANVTQGDASVPASISQKAFEMSDETSIRFELCDGDNCVYVVRLVSVTPETVKSLEEVSAIAKAACQQQIFADELKQKQASVMAIVKAKMAEDRSFEAAVNEVSASDASVSLSDEVSFTYMGETPTGAYASEMKQASRLLCPKQFSEAKLSGAEMVTVYVEKRYESATSALEKSTQRQALATEISRQGQFGRVRAWIDANVEANPPRDGLGQSLLDKAE